MTHEEQINEDIKRAKIRAAPAKLLDVPGKGDTDRDSALRLALEVEHLRKCNEHLANHYKMVLAAYDELRQGAQSIGAKN